LVFCLVVRYGKISNEYSAVMKQFERTESSITDDIVATYGQCPHKAYYALFFPDTRRAKDITTLINQRKKENKISFIAKNASNSPFYSDQLSGKADIITDATLSYEDLTFENIHLRKINGTSLLGDFIYEPILFTADTAIKFHDSIRGHLNLYLYNSEDCINLKNLKMAIIDICKNASIKKVLAANAADQFLNSTIKQIENDFSFIQKSAHGKYEQSKIALKHAKRGGPKKKKVGSEHFKEIPKSYIDKEIRMPRRRVCLYTKDL
jgi:hypothetical protein